MDRFVHGVELQSSDLPKERRLLDLIVSTEWKDNDEETFKDIIADAVGLMLVDANPDICAIGFNLVVIFVTLNPNWKHLEPEANRRFRKYYVGVSPQQPAVVTVKEVKKEKPFSNLRNGNGSVDRRINAYRTDNHVYVIQQNSEIIIAAPSMPDI